MQEYLKWNDVSVLHEMNRRDSENILQYKERKMMTCIYETSAHAQSTAQAMMFRMMYSGLKKKLDTDKIWTDEIDKSAHKLKKNNYL